MVNYLMSIFLCPKGHVPNLFCTSSWVCHVWASLKREKGEVAEQKNTKHCACGPSNQSTPTIGFGVLDWTTFFWLNC